MKRCHRPDLFSWALYDEARDVDFNGYLWVRPEGNIAFDPMPMTAHHRAHLDRLGGLAWIVVTNSDHTRAAWELANQTGAKIAAPRAESTSWPWPVHRWLDEGDELVPGLRAFAMQGSKTPGELALLLEERTLITGDLVRAHVAGALMMLPPDKTPDRAAAFASVARLAALPAVEAVLVGDGWPVFSGGGALLRALAAQAP